MATKDPAGQTDLAPILSGLCASLVGIGLARFAYTPLIPALIATHWFSPGEAAYLGAANFAGYVAGAMSARALAARLPARAVLRAMMALASLTFFACATPVSFGWFFAWRFAAGLAGGVLMVLAAPTVLPFVPVKRRGLASGAIFTGVGLGIAASGTLIPPLLRAGVSQTWLGLGVLATVLTAMSWRGWPGVPPPRTAQPAASPAAGRALGVVILFYGLNAVGLVPHMVFLVDYVARGLGRGIAAGGACWVAFGLGALLGPTATGALADRIGFRRAVHLALLLQSVIVAMPLLSSAQPTLLASAALAGVFAPGIVPLALGRIHLLLAPGSDAARAAWGRATTAWALGQAGAAYVFAYVFARTGDDLPLFAAGSAVLLLALAIDLAASRPILARP
jgi:predicted MFS family arabinose efflux permease